LTNRLGSVDRDRCDGDIRSGYDSHSHIAMENQHF
jgi:hypothetical protein